MQTFFAWENAADREIADIMVGSDDLYALVTLKMLSNALVGRIRKNYRVISLKSMKELLD